MIDLDKAKAVVDTILAFIVPEKPLATYKARRTSVRTDLTAQIVAMVAEGQAPSLTKAAMQILAKFEKAAKRKIATKAKKETAPSIITDAIALVKEEYSGEIKEGGGLRKMGPEEAYGMFEGVIDGLLYEVAYQGNAPGYPDIKDAEVRLERLVFRAVAKACGRRHSGDPVK